MISIKSDREIELLRIAGKIVGDTHNYIKQYIKPGITTMELDQLAESYIRKQGATPSFKGLYGFPNACCISVNEEVVHGIPSNRKLKEGDIVSIDIGACYKGYHGDSAWSYPVGKVSPEKEELLKLKQQLDKYEKMGIKKEELLDMLYNNSLIGDDYDGSEI